MTSSMEDRASHHFFQVNLMSYISKNKTFLNIFHKILSKLHLKKRLTNSFGQNIHLLQDQCLLDFEERAKYTLILMELSLYTTIYITPLLPSVLIISLIYQCMRGIEHRKKHRRDFKSEPSSSSHNNNNNNNQTHPHITNNFYPSPHLSDNNHCDHCQFSIENSF